MMRRLWMGLLIAALGLSAFATTRPDTEDPGGVIRGVFTSQRSRWNVEGSGPTTLVKLQLQRSRKGGNWSHGFPVPIDELKGLTAALAESSGGPVRFELVRDAGSFAFEGSFVAGDGAGHFSFTPSAAYRDELRKMGYGSPSPSEAFTLATHDVSRAFIRDLAGLGYTKLALEELMSMAIHGVTPVFIRELKGLGYVSVPVEELVSMRIHGATPGYIRELRALGYQGVPVEDLVSMRIHGVTPEFVRVANRGGKAVTVDRLVEMRIHGEGEE